MKESNVSALKNQSSVDFNSSLVVSITGEHESGVLLIEHESIGKEAVEARATTPIPENLSYPVDALCLFEQGDPSKPIVIGLLNPTVQISAKTSISDTNTLKLNGRKLDFSGYDQIKLECGKSSITLNKNGKIVLKGNDIISRAAHNNKIKGGSIALN